MPRYEGERLDDKNWNDFKFGFIAFAVTRGTDEIYDGTDTMPTSGPNSKAVKAWNGRAALAAADLIAAVGKEQYKHLRGLQGDAREMWTTLELFHGSGQAATDSLSVWNTFFEASYIDYNQPLKSHIGYILELVDRLTTIFSDPPSANQVLVRILSSLPSPEFDNAVRFVTTHANANDRSWVIAQLLKEEFIIRRGGGLIAPIPSAMATTIPTPTSPADAVPVRCSNCNRRGHVLEDCFQPGGPKEGQIPEWYNRRYQPAAQAHFTQVVAL
jgi:hypothetical protein